MKGRIEERREEKDEGKDRGEGGREGRMMGRIGERVGGERMRRREEESCDTHTKVTDRLSAVILQVCIGTIPQQNGRHLIIVIENLFKKQ